MSQATITRTQRVATTGRIQTVGQLGAELGRMDRLTLESSEAVHKQFAKLDAETQKAWRSDFMIRYYEQRVGVSRDVAETIVGKKRTERKPLQQRAVDAGNKQFAYHVARNGVKAAGKARAEPKAVRVTSDFKAATVKYIESMYEECNRDSIREVIAQLRAFAKRLPKAA